jgi:hypothetical protein
MFDRIAEGVVSLPPTDPGQSHQVPLIFAPSNMLPFSNEFSFSDVIQLHHAAHAKGASVAKMQSDAFPPGKKSVETICSSP